MLFEALFELLKLLLDSSGGAEVSGFFCLLGGQEGATATTGARGTAAGGLNWGVEDAICEGFQNPSEIGIVFGRSNLVRGDQ